MLFNFRKQLALSITSTAKFLLTVIFRPGTFGMSYTELIMGLLLADWLLGNVMKAISVEL
jgi:hypothetical protein